ncbi:hypothetical protein ACO0LD_25625 [Undibacterium sp. Ji83W]|uniref:hypothetical protein n=1 Tax=Undibacterium sp. Ji83W TaxID=3413043 RepID=UPI0033456120
MTTKMSGRFTTVTRLTSETKVLGATAKQWDEALTGDMANSLKIVKEKVEAMRKAEAIAQIDEQKILLTDEVNKTE